MFVASDWIDINRLAGDSKVSDQSEGYEPRRIGGLDSPELWHPHQKGDVVDQQECEMLLKIQIDAPSVFDRFRLFPDISRLTE
jgi:hypothetical protein